MYVLQSSRIYKETPIPISILWKKTRNQNQDQKRRLIEPGTKLKTFAAQFSSCVGPNWWKNLPNALRSTESTDNFKDKLKTFLFKKEYVN